MILKKYTNRMILTISTLTILITNTPTEIKADIPPIKGLYEIFTPDVIGIGQALITKGWIENVYLFAPKNNLARLVIEKFWYKPIDPQTREIIVDDLFLIKKIHLFL